MARKPTKRVVVIRSDHPFWSSMSARELSEKIDVPLPTVYAALQGGAVGADFLAAVFVTFGLEFGAYRVMSRTDFELGSSSGVDGRKPSRVSVDVKEPVLPDGVPLRWDDVNREDFDFVEGFDFVRGHLTEYGYVVTCEDGYSGLVVPFDAPAAVWEVVGRRFGWSLSAEEFDPAYRSSRGALYLRYPGDLRWVEKFAGRAVEWVD